MYQGSRMHACRRWHSDLIGNKAAIPAHRLTNQGFEDGLGLETLARSLTEACARSLSEEPLVVKAVVATSPPKTPAHVFRGPTHLKDISTACEHVGRNLTGKSFEGWVPSCLQRTSRATHRNEASVPEARPPQPEFRSSSSCSFTLMTLNRACREATDAKGDLSPNFPSNLRMMAKMDESLNTFLKTYVPKQSAQIVVRGHVVGRDGHSRYGGGVLDLSGHMQDRS